MKHIHHIIGELTIKYNKKKEREKIKILLTEYDVSIDLQSYYKIQSERKT